MYNVMYFCLRGGKQYIHSFKSATPVASKFKNPSEPRVDQLCALRVLKRRPKDRRQGKDESRWLFIAEAELVR